MVPFIKLCLGTMLPMLGMAKQDNMRWVFATGHFHWFSCSKSDCPWNRGNLQKVQIYTEHFYVSSPHSFIDLCA